MESYILTTGEASLSLAPADPNAVTYVISISCSAHWGVPVLYFSGRKCRYDLYPSRAATWHRSLPTFELDKLLRITGCCVASFLDAINRGGLARPSAYTFLLCIHCRRVFEETRTNPELKSTFLEATCHRSLFIITVIDRLTDIKRHVRWGHDWKRLIKVLRPTRHKMGHFGDVFPSESLG